MKSQIPGQSQVIQELNQLITRVASSRSNILIVGESGTGKELVAQSIHAQSAVAKKPFIAVNCGAMTESLIESELFGHVKGSFTGAITDKVGLFQAADGGTLFLDEVGELSLQMQVKLLRAIQERSFRKLGGLEDIEVDVRIISATNRNLEESISKGTFREDLFYRLNVIQIKTPPLRERGGDIEFLIRYFLEEHAKKKSSSFQGISQEAIQALCNYSWPGNVRELENILERSLALGSGLEISLHSLPESIRRGQAEVSPYPSSIPIDLTSELQSKGFHLDEALSRLESHYMREALRISGGNQKEAARLLGIPQKRLTSRIKQVKR